MQKKISVGLIIFSTCFLLFQIVGIFYFNNFKNLIDINNSNKMLFFFIHNITICSFILIGGFGLKFSKKWSKILLNAIFIYLIAANIFIIYHDFNVLLNKISNFVPIILKIIFFGLLILKINKIKIIKNNIKKNNIIDKL